MATPKKVNQSAPVSGGGRMTLEQAKNLPATQFGGMRLKGEQGHVDKGGVVSAKPNAKAPLGQGGRFAAFVDRLVSEGKSQSSAQAIAASAGRKAHGSKAMARYSAEGRRK